MKPLLLKLIFLLVVFVGITIGFTLQHEQAHIRIYEEYHIPSKMHFQWNLITPAYVQATNGSIAQENCNDTCTAAQINNEIVGYNVETIVVAMFGIFFLYLMYQEIDKESENDILPYPKGWSILTEKN